VYDRRLRAEDAVKRALVVSLTPIVLLALASSAAAHSAAFKSPGPGMHFSQGQPLVIFADLFDSRDGKGFIVCPGAEKVSNTAPPPDYTEPPRTAQCSGGGTPTGWPAFQITIDGALQTDVNTNKSTIPHTIAFDHNINPSPIGFFRFVAPTAGLAPGPHQIVVRGMFSMDGLAVTNLDSQPLTILIDAPPAKPIMTLTADLTGTVSWNDVIVVGNGHAVTASGSLVIRNSLVTGLSGLGGSVTDAAIEGSTFEDTGPLNLTLGNGAVSIKGNEWRANNRLTFAADNPDVPFIVTLKGSGANTKLFQGNRVGAGQSSFGGTSWLVGGDTDDLSNVFIGPRTVVNIVGSNTIVRGNFSHHNYRGAWSQGFNFFYDRTKTNILTEHNFIRDSSWPLQYLAGEFRYNVVYGYGHNWLRTAASGASIHHNLFVPGGDGGLNAGIECYGGESGLLIYNNTFDGGGAAIGDFAKATIAMSGGSQVASLRNNVMAFSRDESNGTPGTARVVGGAAAYLYADYNAFYSPDNTNHTNYDYAGAGAHDPGQATGGQLASTPFAGARITTDGSRMIESAVDEAAIWQGTQKVSQVLALFRERYTPKAGSAIIDAGDPKDNDAQGRRSDIGAIDLGGHDQDKLGKFGTPPLPTGQPDGGADAGATGGAVGTTGAAGTTGAGGIVATGGTIGTGGTTAAAGNGGAGANGGAGTVGVTGGKSGCGCSMQSGGPGVTSLLLWPVGALMMLARRRRASL
jgi:MYXO-CTERM domain-containing protein